VNLDVLDISILGPGFLAGLVVLATHVPLGREVLRRGIIFIDLAVAQTAALGAIAATVAGWDPHGFGAQAAAVSAALLAGMFLTWTESRFGDAQEAIIGVLFVLAATGGILVLASHPQGGEELRDLLTGQILWVDVSRLWPAGLVSIIVLSLWFSVRSRLGRGGFYVLFAFMVTSSVQLVGVYLVFASLILPALAARGLGPVRGLWTGYVVGTVGYGLGLLVSSVWDLPTGPIIVWCLAGSALVAGASRSRDTRREAA
jgi:zinc/manganese transport system permease protein